MLDFLDNLGDIYDILDFVIDIAPIVLLLLCVLTPSTEYKNDLIKLFVTFLYNRLQRQNLTK